MRLRPILASLACLLLTLACGGGGGGGGGSDISLGGGTPMGNLTVKLGSDSFPGSSQVVLSIEKIEGSTDGSTWTPLGNVRSAVDLMLLQNGNSTPILSAVSVPVATYTQFRLTWATVSYSSVYNTPSFVLVSSQSPLVPATQLPLTMPATTVLSGSVKVASTGTSTALLMLNGQQAVQDRSNSYAFQATGSAYNQAATAHLAGNLASSTLPLGGVEVYAETVDATGVATVQRRAFTDLSGNYALEGLPIGSTYYVVAQPGSRLSSYQALASDPLVASAATTYTANLGFGSSLTPANSLNVIVAPASSATQVTWAELRKSLATGGGYQTLIVRSQTLFTGLEQDTTNFYGLYPDSYFTAAQRSTSGAAPAMKVGSPNPAILSSGGTYSVNVSYP